MGKICNALVVLIIGLTCINCSNKQQKKNVEARAYGRKCSVFSSIPPVEEGKKEVIFLGHSLVNEFLVDEYMPHGDSIVYTNMGIGGDDTRGVYNRRDLAFKRKPYLIVMELGINDIINNEPMDSITYYYGSILDAASQQDLNVIVCATIPNIKNNERQIILLNEYLKNKTKELSYRYIDLFSPMEVGGALSSEYDCGDGTHLSGLGYQVWADSLKQYLW